MPLSPCAWSSCSRVARNCFKHSCFCASKCLFSSSTSCRRCSDPSTTSSMELHWAFISFRELDSFSCISLRRSWSWLSISAHCCSFCWARALFCSSSQLCSSTTSFRASRSAWSSAMAACCSSSLLLRDSTSPWSWSAQTCRCSSTLTPGASAPAPFGCHSSTAAPVGDLRPLVPGLVMVRGDTRAADSMGDPRPRLPSRRAPQGLRGAVSARRVAHGLAPSAVRVAHGLGG
mmetsp:Transcript_123889/g.284158  ORF Transcript_123889/g.284158 Transcript_123889/m.284158 type:complete len:232 (-) Transcript_123889:311-1006(-)